MKPRFAYGLGFLTAFSASLSPLSLALVHSDLHLLGPVRFLGLVTVPAVGAMAFLSFQNGIIDRLYAWGSFLLAAGVWTATLIAMR